MRYLITHSLLAAWLYSMRDNPYEEGDDPDQETALQEFLHVLRREPTPTTQAMLNGIDFENLVTAILEGKIKTKSVLGDVVEPNTGEVVEGKTALPKWYDAACKVADMIRGAKLQYVASKPVTIAGMEFLLYGRLDALKEGRIFDIKFSQSYERGKYRDSTQHPMYCKLIPEAMNFTYIISNGQDVWTEVYWWDEVQRIEPIIADFVTWLNDMNLMETYKEHWGAKQ